MSAPIAKPTAASQIKVGSTRAQLMSISFLPSLSTVQAPPTR